MGGQAGEKQVHQYYCRGPPTDLPTHDSLLVLVMADGHPELTGTVGRARGEYECMHACMHPRGCLLSHSAVPAGVPSPCPNIAERAPYTLQHPPVPHPPARVTSLSHLSRPKP